MAEQPANPTDTELRVTRLVIANLLDDGEQIRAVYREIDESEDPDRGRAVIAVTAVEMLADYAVQVHGSKDAAVEYLRQAILQQQTEA